MITIPAIFENGVFKPKVPVDIPPGSELTLHVSGPAADPVAAMKSRYPRSFGGFPQGEAESIAQSIQQEFERINPDGRR